MSGTTIANDIKLSDRRSYCTFPRIAHFLKWIDSCINKTAIKFRFVLWRVADDCFNSLIRALEGRLPLDSRGNCFSELLSV